MLEASRDDRFEAIYRLTLALGLRLGEVLGVRWQDVDLERRTLRVVQAVHRADGKLQQVEVKTDRSRRTLPLSDSLVVALKAHRSHQRLARLAAGDQWRDTGLVFTTRLGTPIEPRNLQTAFKRLLNVAGLPSSTRFHDLRHSCASLLLAQGEHPRVIMELLGHSQISVTMNTYAHVLPEANRAAIVNLDTLLNGPPSIRTS